MAAQAARISSSASSLAANAADCVCEESSGVSGITQAATEKTTEAAAGLRQLLELRDAGADRTVGEDGADVERPDVNVPHEIVVSHHEEKGLSIEAHPPERVVGQEMGVRRWEDLGREEQMGWRQR